MTRRLTTPVVIALTVALIGAAFAVRLTQPDDELLERPFVAVSRFGEQAEGRDLTFSASDAYLADRITTAEWVGETDGVWLVIDATIGSKLGVSVPYATLTIGGLRYTSSDRPDDAALGAPIDAGLPMGGSFVFELPRSVLDDPAGRHVTVRFATAFQVRLDSAIDLTLDLTRLRHEDSVALQSPGLVLP